MSEYVPGSVWFYAPNKIAPIVFCVLFLISGAVHFYQMMLYKSWRITMLLPWAALLMISGFVTREIGAYNLDNLDYVIASTVLFLSGPPVYALINYLILSRILYYIPYLSPLHPGRVVTTFVGIDAVIEILIGQGGWRASNPTLSDREREIGVNIVKAALLIQVVMFALFAVLAAYLERSASRAKVLTSNIRTVLHVLYVSSAIVTIRCIYRIVEFFQGFAKPPYASEPYFWVFEAVIMLINSVLLNVWYPAKRLPKSNKVFLDPDGVTERYGPGWDDERPWPVTVFDPFDLWSAVTGKHGTKFWNMTDEQLEQLRAQRKANKRNWWSLLLDPFHLWGPKGYLGKRLQSSKNSQAAASTGETKSKHSETVATQV